MYQLCTSFQMCTRLLTRHKKVTTQCYYKRQDRVGKSKSLQGIFVPSLHYQDATDQFGRVNTDPPSVLCGLSGGSGLRVAAHRRCVLDRYSCLRPTRHLLHPKILQERIIMSRRRRGRMICSCYFIDPPPRAPFFPLPWRVKISLDFQHKCTGGPGSNVGATRCNLCDTLGIKTNIGPWLNRCQIHIQFYYIYSLQK